MPPLILKLNAHIKCRVKINVMLYHSTALEELWKYYCAPSCVTPTFWEVADKLLM